MYLKRKEVISGNKIKLIEDLEYLLSEEGFNTIIRFQQEKERGKVFFANRGSSFWSFSATNYKDSVSTETSLTDYDSGDENLNGYVCGSFKMYINDSYDNNKIVSAQTKIAGSLYDGVSAAIPRNDIFSYEIYSSFDGWDWGVIIKFENLTFYAFFGDKSKGLDKTGNYGFGSYSKGSTKFSIPYDFNNELTSIQGGATPKFCLNDVGDSSSNIFYSYDDINETIIVSGQGELNCEYSQSGSISENGLKGVYRNFYNEYSGLSQIVKTELYINNPNGIVNTIKKFYDFDFGYANLNKADSLETKTINGERIKFIVNGRKEKVMNIENRASYNNLIFWFKVK